MISLFITLPSIALKMAFLTDISVCEPMLLSPSSEENEIKRIAFAFTITTLIQTKSSDCLPDKICLNHR